MDINGTLGGNLTGYHISEQACDWVRDRLGGVYERASKIAEANKVLGLSTSFLNPDLVKFEQEIEALRRAVNGSNEDLRRYLSQNMEDSN